MSRCIEPTTLLEHRQFYASVKSTVVLGWRGHLIAGWCFDNLAHAQHRLEEMGWELDLSQWQRTLQAPVTHLGVRMGMLEPC
jgi:hypothetical protein